MTTRAAPAGEAPLTLAAWREAEGLTTREAARRLRVSIAAIVGIEAGSLEPGPALAIDIFQRTGGAVLLGVEPDPVASSSSAASAGEGADLQTRPSPSPGFLTGTRLTADAFPGPRPFVRLRREMACGHADVLAISPRAAARLGMELIQAALAARGTDGRGGEGDDEA